MAISLASTDLEFISTVLIKSLELTKYSDSTDGREDNSFRPPINDNSNTLDTVIIMISLIITGAEYRC